MNMEPWIILAVLAVLILFFGLYVLLYRKKRLSGREIDKIINFWKEIEALAQQHPEQAILKADKLLDHALKMAGFSGTLGEKMKKARSVFRDNDGVWSAHKLRNQIAHEIDVKVSVSQAQTGLRQFKKALSDLGVPL
jgi:hypothetical protein